MDFWLLILTATITSILTVFCVRFFDNITAAYFFNKKVRNYHVYGEPSVLDVCEKNIFRYRQFELIIKDLEGLQFPAHVIKYIECLLIARGAFKAFTVRRELINYKKVLYHMVHQYESLSCDLGRFLSLYYAEHRKVEENKRQDHAILHKELAIMRGAVNILRDCRGWTKQICCVPRFPNTEYKQMFLAGDTGIWCKPDGMIAQRLYEHFCGIISQCRDKMRELIKVEGWPLLPQLDGKRIKCKVCSTEYPKCWVANYVCWRCDDEIRSQGKCPSERDFPPHICPHTKKCFSCEMISCEKCGLIRGDSTMVSQIVQQSKPDFVFLDFDKTLCETRSGLEPITGNHGLNPDLFKVLLFHPKAHVVTRQNTSHASAIQAFLRDHIHLIDEQINPNKHNFNIHCLGSAKPKITKAEMIKRIMGTTDGFALFVDDTTREHLNDQIKSVPKLKRILFSTTDFSLKPGYTGPIRRNKPKSD